jgi:hypothetical protein
LPTNVIEELVIGEISAIKCSKLWHVVKDCLTV